MRYAWLFIIANSLFYTLCSQNAEYFHLHKPNYKAQASLYNSINFIDSRIDTTDFGKVFEILDSKDLTFGGRFAASRNQDMSGKTFATTKRLSVQPRESLSTQFNWLLYHFIDSTAGNKEMLVQLRKFKFYEIFQNKFYQGFCMLRLNLYETNDKEFCQIGYLDTVIYAEGEAVTKELFNGASSVISDFIFSYLNTNGTQRNCFNQKSIMNIDSIEKSNMALYANKYINGAYFSYESFKNQVPDMQLADVNRKKGEIETLILVTNEGRKIKRNIHTVHSIVYENKPYVIGDFGCYPMEKRGNDFYFFSKARISPDETSMDYAENFGFLIGGITGQLIGIKAAKNSAKGLFETKLDHLNGSFIVLKRID